MQTAEQLKTEINLVRKQLGWSINQLAEVIAADDDACEVDMTKFTEKLKKQLQRKTTSAELLEGYLQIIRNHPDYKRTNRIAANPIRLDVVDLDILRAVQGIAAQALFVAESE